MIFRSLCRPQRQLQAISSTIATTRCKQRSTASSKTTLLPRCSHLPSSARRGLATQPTGFEGHRIPTLPHDETYTEHGVDGFLSPEGYDLAWTQYQSMMIEKLNTLTMGTADATTKPLRLVEKYGRSTEQASLFNHASMACNNHLFFSCLSPKITQPSATLVAEIEDSFSSYDTLRMEMIETADAMFGPGFVWIVKDEEMGRMKLLCTYLAGSPYKLAHFRSQQNDMATYNTRALSASRSMNGRDSSGSFGPYSRNAVGSDHALGGYNSSPILCVNTWEHAYMRDYGVGGKRMYLERWWDRVDWAVVERNARLYGPETKRYPATAGLDVRLGQSFRKHRVPTT